MSGGGIASIPPSTVYHCFRGVEEATYLHQNPHTVEQLRMSTRKRKAEDDLGELSLDRMSSSPSPTPASLPRPVLTPASSRTVKRARTNISGRPLSLPRLMETLTPEEMRGLLCSICDTHPDIGAEIVSTAPRPSASSALAVLDNYQTAFRQSFPYGDRTNSDYSFNRVRLALLNLLDALKDFTPHFLPPNENQVAVSLQYLDGATNVLHEIPDWDSYQHNRYKHEAYEEFAKAWSLVIREAAKKGGGIAFQIRGWDRKLAKHNDLSGGRMVEAINEVRNQIGWGDNNATSSQHGDPQENLSIRQQLLSGTYGANQPIEVGPW